MSGFLSSHERYLRNLFKDWQCNRFASGFEAGDPGSFSSCPRDIGFLSVIKRCQASSPFEALNSAFLTMCVRDVRPPVVMKRGPMSFYRAVTGDSDILSS